MECTAHLYSTPQGYVTAQVSYTAHLSVQRTRISHSTYAVLKCIAGTGAACSTVVSPSTSSVHSAYSTQHRRIAHHRCSKQHISVLHSVKYGTQHKCSTQHQCFTYVLYMQDLSGGNVMLTSSPINPHGFQAKVGDFGLSREANASARLAGNVYGTITHMAPEVMLHAHMGPVSCASDFFAQLVTALSVYLNLLNLPRCSTSAGRGLAGGVPIVTSQSPCNHTRSSDCSGRSLNNGL